MCIQCACIARGQVLIKNDQSIYAVYAYTEWLILTGDDERYIRTETDYYYNDDETLCKLRFIYYCLLVFYYDF